MRGINNDLGVGDVVDRGERSAFDSNCFMQSLNHWCNRVGRAARCCGDGVGRWRVQMVVTANDDVEHSIIFYRRSNNDRRCAILEIRKGTLKFGDKFKLHGEYLSVIDITFPHTYKSQVLGSGLEVIDNKYLTITLTPYDSIIKDCQMYQAELLKVKKIFKDSEIEQAYLAKLDDQVVIAKTHEQLMRKVIKVKEAFKDNHSHSEVA